MISIRTSSTRQRFSRRGLLASIGASAAFLPLLHAERAPAATASGFPKRIVTITWGHGVPQSAFYPAAADPVGSPVLAPLMPFASKVNLVAGLDYQTMLEGGHDYDGHFSFPVIFTGTYRNTGDQNCTAEGPSIDQVISDAIDKEVALPMPLLNITVSGDSTSFRGADAKNTGEDDPGRLFERLFSSALMPPEAVQRLRARRKSVLDFVGAELGGFSARMGTEDRAKIEAHLESIRQLERRLNASSGSCMAPVVNTDSEDYQDQIKAMIDISAMALRCDMTRVVSMGWALDGGYLPNSMPFLGINREYHAIAHDGTAAYEEKIKIDTWFYSQVASLAQQLNESVEDTTTALDNTVIVVANDMNEGSNHFVGGMPFVLVGGCGGALRTGQVLRVGDWATKAGQYWKGKSGVAHNRLLATLCNAMDLPMAGFGDPNYAGNLPELLA